MLILIIFGLVSSCAFTDSCTIFQLDGIHTPSSGGEDSSFFETRWWSRDNTSPQYLADNDVIMGDRIEIDAEFEDNPDNPLMNVESISWRASKGFVENRSGELLVPDPGYDPFFQGMRMDQFTWECIEGILQGDNVRITLSHSNSDTDVFVYWANIDNSRWTTETSITGRQMITGNPRVEHGAFIAQMSGSIMVGIYCYDHQPGQYNLTIDTMEEENGSVQQNSVRYRTWTWGRNVTLSIDFIGNTVSGSLINRSIHNVTFQNFFAPAISNIQIISEGILKHITWDLQDRNRFESHQYEVHFSYDNGLTYQLLSRGLTTRYYLWNTAGFRESNEYRIQVRAIDASGLVGYGFSPAFSAGSLAEFTGLFWYAIESSGNASYVQGSVNNSISWNVWIQGDNQLDFEIYLDGEVIETGLTRGEEITVDTDGLSAGVHAFTLSLGSETRTRNDTIFVEVFPDPHYAYVQTTCSLSAGVIMFLSILTVEVKRRRDFGS